MNKYIINIIIIFLFSSIFYSIPKSLLGQKSSGYMDVNYFSLVFDREKTYRLYLPVGYNDGNKRFPVIYFFHGWGGRYFKDDGAKLAYDKIQNLVDKFQVILVMWDGNIVESEPRPYNIGMPEQVRFDIQMKDYFLELVSHIDSNYRTIKSRESRGIIGYSMGGFMSFYLAGKYPDMISAAVNLTGSPGFYIGYPNNKTLYPIRYLFPNLRDVQLRFHNSSDGELSSLNREVNEGALHDGDLTYQYWEFDGGHKVDNLGETVVFEKAMDFVAHAFDNPQHRREYWHHYDLYKDFRVWGYSVNSNKEKPGFIYLRHVSKAGFGLYTNQWLPDGPPVEGEYSILTTAPIYDSQTEYLIKTYDQENDTIALFSKSTDQEGRLTLVLGGTGSEVGIYKKGGRPNLVFLNYSLQKGRRMIRIGKENSLLVKIGNLGGELDISKKILFELRTNDNNVSVTQPNGEFMPKLDQQKLVLPPITIYCSKSAPSDAQPISVKFNLTMKYDSLTFREEFDVPVSFDVPDFTDVAIDDGILIRDSIFGIGNGDGIAEPGEEIMIYTEGHRTQLFTDDPWVVIDKSRRFEEFLPTKWRDNGVTPSSIVKIADKCPKGHVITFLAKYETKDYMPITRHVTWGKIHLRVN